ncbi:hypothetical protein BSR42_10180 [Megasphaera cerevisiae]|nr:hypothetical protein BSR42_10180 [Megasphaera cerevisiae]
MDVDPAFISDNISFVGTFLYIIPLACYGAAIGVDSFIKVRKHMPPHHRYQHDANHFDGTKYRMWARNIGQQAYAVIDHLLSSQITEEQAYRSCMGVLQCSKKYGNERLEAACSKAITMKSCTYSTISTILKNGQDKILASTTSKPTPRHENLRGSEAYV